MIYVQTLNLLFVSENFTSESLRLEIFENSDFKGALLGKVRIMGFSS